MDREAIINLILEVVDNQREIKEELAEIKKELNCDVRFRKPTQEEVKQDFISKKVPESVAKEYAEKFINHYEKTGWKTGKNKMKRWRSAVNEWIKRMKETGVLNSTKIEIKNTL